METEMKILKTKLNNLHHTPVFQVPPIEPTRWDRFKHLIDRVWILGRKNDNWYLRFYPNPGFCFVFINKRVSYSKFYGLNVR